MQRPHRIHPARPLRVLLVDAHEVSRAACSALLRTEGCAVGDVAPGEHVIALARELEPEVVVVDARCPGGCRTTAEQLRNLPCAPLVLLTSSAECDRRYAFVARLPFLAKADICAEAILRAVQDAAAAASGRTESG